MTCRLFGAKPLSEPMVVYYELLPWKQTSVNFEKDHHDDVIKWKIFRVTGHLCGEFIGPRWIPCTKASDAELWCFLWIKGWVNNREAGDLRRYRAHYDVAVMRFLLRKFIWNVVCDMAVNLFRPQCVNGHGIEYTWWRHQTETFSALLALCAKNSPFTALIMT